MPWRGGAIAVVDLGRLTGLAALLSSDVSRRRNAIVRVGGSAAALPGDGVCGAVQIPDERVSPGAAAPFCRECVELDDEEERATLTRP